MKRKLLKQISNEWQSNVWLAVELLIVSVVIWYIADEVYTKYATYNEPRGFDTEHCYLLSFDMLSEKSPDYVPYESVERQNDDLVALVNRLKTRPEIEAVGLGQNAYPYNGSNSGTILTVDTFSSNGYCVRRYVSPDFIKVFKYRGVNGETPEQLADMLAKNPHLFLASDNLLRHQGVEHLDAFVGREFSNEANRDTLELGAAIEVVRYSDFSQGFYSVSMVWAFPEKYYYHLNELVVRVKDNMDKDFAENIMADSWKSLRVGNYYISSVKSFDDIRDQFQRSEYNDMRNSIAGVSFLLLNIFLGLLGTFWFRTQQRVSEIAIRKVNGATSGDVFRRMIGEGELLLLLVVPLAAVLDYALTYFELNSNYGGAYFEPVRFTMCVLISWGLMALMVALGIAIPAYKAMKLQPAQALSEE